ncbi:protein of unknown function [Limnospira indica PCC 8005]|uniref:Uncharacterized protein n=1 Tax=Limnospira indica PCC 8005 TaxID=376219 RepID=A0A9P1KGJ6_9CYAN|nr:protein of unknown function [Limnospira indica PCC 8005]
MTTVKAMAKPFSGFLAINSAMTAVIMTVMGPVGSEIRLGVPPNKEAKNPINIAPHKPAEAPAPEAIPKARDIGKATTAAVKPPNMSPLRLRKFMVLIICIN